MRRATRMLLMNPSRRETKERSWEAKEISEDRYREERPEPARYPDAGEARFRDRHGRERYDDGRFAPRNYQGENSGKYSPYYPGPVSPYSQERKRTRREQDPMNKIGFSVAGEMERIPEESHQREYPGQPDIDDMSYRRGNSMGGYASGREGSPVTQEEAQRWADAMENEDGTKGAHWSMEQTRQVQAQQGIDCDPAEFFLAMNMMYSDYVKVARKLGVNKVDFYAWMAKAFLEDKDAGPDKLKRYFEYVAAG